METTPENLVNVFNQDPEGVWLVTSNAIEAYEEERDWEKNWEEISSFDSFNLEAEPTIGEEGIILEVLRDMADSSSPDQETLVIKFPFLVHNSGAGYPFNITVYQGK